AWNCPFALSSIASRARPSVNLVEATRFCCCRIGGAEGEQDPCSLEGRLEKSCARRRPRLSQKFNELMFTQEKYVDILLVEDDPDDATLTLRALKQRDMGDRVFHAIDGDEALDFIFATHMYGEWSLLTAPKVILLDLKLRKVSGLNVLRELKSNE